MEDKISVKLDREIAKDLRLFADTYDDGFRFWKKLALSNEDNKKLYEKMIKIRHGD